jgi:protein O-mannosyl-transferase
MAMTVGLLLVAAIAPYVNSLGGSFHFDDEWEIVRNAGIRSWGEFVRRPASRSVPRFINYLNFQLFGLENLAGWHATNMAFHAACVMMLWLVLGRLLTNNRAAMIGALLFAVHPLASEPVNYIRARWVLIYTALALAALYAIIRAHRAASGKARIGWGAMLVATVVLAGLTKEVGGIYAAGICALYLAAFVLPGRLGRRSVCLAIGSMSLLVVGGSLGGLWAMGKWELVRQFGSHPLLGHHSAAMMTVFWRYVSLAAWPLPGRLSVDHYVPYVPTRTYAFTDADVLIAMAGIALLLVATIYLLRKRPAVGLLLAFPLIGLAPYFFVPTIDILVEYKSYLPLAGCCGLLGLLGAWLSRLRFKTASILIGLLLLTMAVGTFVRNRAWRTERTLWEDAVAKSPRKARTVNVLAWVLLTDEQSPDPVRGLALARKSFDHDQVDPWWFPGDPHMLDTLAEAYYANGRYDIAIDIEQSLIERNAHPIGHFRKQLRKFQRAQRLNRRRQE